VAIQVLLVVTFFWTTRAVLLYISRIIWPKSHEKLSKKYHAPEVKMARAKDCAASPDHAAGIVLLPIDRNNKGGQASDAKAEGDETMKPHSAEAAADTGSVHGTPAKTDQAEASRSGESGASQPGTPARTHPTAESVKATTPSTANTDTKQRLINESTSDSPEPMITPFRIEQVHDANSANKSAEKLPGDEPSTTPVADMKGAAVASASKMQVPATPVPYVTEPDDEETTQNNGDAETDEFSCADMQAQSTTNKVRRGVSKHMSALAHSPMEVTQELSMVKYHSLDRSGTSACEMSTRVTAMSFHQQTSTSIGYSVNPEPVISPSLFATNSVRTAHMERLLNTPKTCAYGADTQNALITPNSLRVQSPEENSDETDVMRRTPKVAAGTELLLADVELLKEKEIQKIVAEVIATQVRCFCVVFTSCTLFLCGIWTLLCVGKENDSHDFA
jgi:hypothetical protein